MTAKVTLSFSDDTIADARRYAQRDGMSLSAWVDQAAREKALRELFGAHAAAVHRAGFDYEAAARADEQEIEMVDTELFGRGRGQVGRGRGQSGRGRGQSGRGRGQSGRGRGTEGPGAAQG